MDYRKKITLFPKDDETSLQSWTYNLLKLGFGTFRNNTVELIFEARVEDNYFFMNPHAAKKIDFLQSFKDEHETISAYAVECSRVLIYYTTNDKATINTELLKKYVTIINKKGHELENKINKEIIDFYHENGLFLNVENVSELDIEFNNLSSEDSNEMQILNKHIIPMRNHKITSLIERYFRQLKTSLESTLNKDFNDKNVKDLIIMYLGFDNPIYYFKKSEKGFYKSGVKFREVSYDYVVKSVKNYKNYSNNNSTKNMLFRLFQRKQKY